MHPESLLAAALRAQPQTPERNARIFWLGAKQARRLIREGRIELADMMVDEMHSAADRSPPSLAKHFRRTANDIGLQCTAARLEIAEGLARAVR